MRLSLGFGLGPLRVSQRVGLPRGNRSRPGYFSQFEVCTVQHRTRETEDRCPRRHPDGFAAEDTPAEKWITLGFVVAGWLLCCGIFWPVFGAGAALWLFKAGIAFILLAVAVTVALLAVGLALLVLMSPVLLVWAVREHRRDLAKREVATTAVRQDKVQRTTVKATLPEIGQHVYVPHTDPWMRDAHGIQVCGTCTRRKQNPMHGEGATGPLDSPTTATESQRHTYVPHTDQWKHHNGTLLCGRCEKPFENWRHTYAGAAS